jgi:phenylpyruvate tautomerase PptA (4-oxalocrotonate tautomerase family)
MPIITMTGPIISLEQKRELAQRLTKVASEVYQRSPS